MFNKHTLLKAKRQKRLDTLVFLNLRWAAKHKASRLDMVKVRALLGSKNASYTVVHRILRSYFYDDFNEPACTSPS